MYLVLYRSFYIFTVERVALEGIHRHDDRLVHLVAYYPPGPDFTFFFHFLYPFIPAMVTAGLHLPYSQFSLFFDSQQPGYLFLDPVHFAMIYKLPGRKPEPKLEQLFAGVFDPLVQFIIAQSSNFLYVQSLPAPAIKHCLLQRIRWTL
jgi:hypothetical protein